MNTEISQHLITRLTELADKQQKDEVTSAIQKSLRTIQTIPHVQSSVVLEGWHETNQKERLKFKLDISELFAQLREYIICSTKDKAREQYAKAVINRVAELDNELQDLRTTIQNS